MVSQFTGYPVEELKSDWLTGLEKRKGKLNYAKVIGPYLGRNKS